MNTLQIGHLRLDLPVVQAALSGYSDWPMRALAREMGAPYTIAEVAIDSFINKLRNRSRTRHHLLVHPQDHPVAAQLTGSDAEQFAEAATCMADAGFDVIDINFGCPAKRASGKCRGGYHLGDPATAIQILERVRKAVPDEKPVTVKMRRGVDDTDASRQRFFEILGAAESLGLSAATIHGRTVEQKYVGASRWEFLREVRDRFPRMTLLGSGDLFTAEDCVRMIRTTGVDGVTAARGAIGNPWIFAHARALLDGDVLPAPPCVHEQRRVLQRHLELAQQVLPADQYLRQVRKFCLFYAAWHPQDNAVRDDFLKVRTEADWERVLQRWYDEDRCGRFPEHPGHLNQRSMIGSVSMSD
jgi:tRNA-dihydrouridine synthase B